MTRPDSDKPRPWSAPKPLDYRGSDPNRNPQWATDESAYASCLVYSAIALTVIGSVIGTLLWFFWEVISSVF